MNGEYLSIDTINYIASLEKEVKELRAKLKEKNEQVEKEDSEEIWKDIKGYEGIYQVSNLGNVRKLEEIIPTHNLKQMLADTGHLRVNLYKQSARRKEVNINKLVAEAFIPNEKNLRLVGHKDGNKQNNYVENLFWAKDTKKSSKLQRDVEEFLKEHGDINE